MIKEKKKQIVKAEKAVLQSEMKATEVSGEVKKPQVPVGVEQKKKIADAVKAVIKSTQEEQDKLKEISVLLNA